MHMGLVWRWSTTLLLPTGHRSNERPSFFLKKHLSFSFSLSMYSFLSTGSFFPKGFARRDTRKEHGNIETVARRSTFIVRCRCTRCRVLFSCRSKRARSMHRRARWEINSLNSIRWFRFENPFEASILSKLYPTLKK